MPTVEELALADKLRLAAARGQTDIVAQLRKQGAKFDVDRDGRTALHFACQNGHLETVSALLKEQISVNAADFIGQTALQRAAGEGHREVVKELLRAGADPDKQDELGNCALHEAAWRGYSETVEVLCAAGAKLSLENAAGFVPLHLAAQHGHNQTARMLLLAGCEPDIPNTYGDTALHTSCRYGHAGVTRILISARCNINIQNKNGDTALHIAAAMGRRKLTRILLEADAERHLQNKQKETPLDIAVRKEAREIADFLTHPPSVLPGPARSTSRSRHKGAVKREKPRLRQVSSDDTTRHRRRHASDSPHDHHNHHHHHHQHHRNASGSNRHGRRMKGARSSGRRANVPHSVPWSPYGCHYSPNPKEFPKPKLDSLPPQPLQKGELYYIDLAGNIRKGPVGVGTACYCSPLFRRLESRIDHDRAEISHNLETTKNKLTQRISALELQTRSQLASLDQRLSLWERMRRQGSPLRPHSPSAHISTGRLNEIQTNGTLTRSRSEEKLAQGPTHRPSSTGGLPRAKSSHQVDSSYKNLVVRSTPTSDTGRVLVAGAASKLRQKRSKDHRLKQSALAARSKFMQDFELSSGSDSDGEEDEREEEEVTVRSEKMEDEVDVSRSMTRVEDDGVVMAGEDKYMTVKHKTSPSEKSKRPVEGDQGEENSSPPPVVKATVNFKPGTEIYELRHQDHLVTTYLNRIQTNVRTLREKFEKQLQVSQEDLAPSGELSKAQARVAMVSPQVPLPPAPGAVQVLPQLCSSSSAASSSGIGHSTDTSSGVPKRVLPQKPLLEKDEHNDSGYSITRFNNSPPFTHPGNSNSGSPEVPDQDSNYHSSEENSLTPTEEANRRAVSGKHAAQSTIVPPPHPQPPSWRPPPPVTASSSVPPPSTSTGLWRPQPPDYETATVKRLTKDFLKPHMAVPNQVTQPPSRPPPLTPTYEVYQVYGQNPPVSGYQHGHSMPYTRSSLV